MSRFNVTPIKTALAEPSDALKQLKSKVVVIHSDKDYLKSSVHVAKLALVEGWAPPGTLSFYDDKEGHMVLIDKPAALAKTYRKAVHEEGLL